eukprot:CAMPEP_0177249796 /NCGR_PEP_ID=MMETSP0367-20130122/52971_1 /TAXON_ID=447022 ORGANISM="Scrippsiella hangoei-like, Strain SHHI-4" /NCGR_SAMPLE_ID=MMETSP0367 /ASSEMBLY_ACC=CAM_ASM_000362 /LENGTH=56 /DNA_ID=CAMNT_0018702381 /DNA_START=23 /DNA_END=193 /DNA_ORIENTATION=+
MPCSLLRDAHVYSVQMTNGRSHPASFARISTPTIMAVNNGWASAAPGGPTVPGLAL